MARSIDCLLVIPAAFNDRRAGQAGGASQQRSWSSSALVFRGVQALDPCLRRDDEQNQKRSAAISRRIAVAVAVASGAHDARPLFRAPSAAVSRGRPGRAAGEATDGLAFSRGPEARSKSPAATHALAGQDARQASPRGGLLFGLLFSWPRKRKVTRAASAARNRSSSARKRANPPKQTSQSVSADKPAATPYRQTTPPAADTADRAPPRATRECG